MLLVAAALVLAGCGASARRTPASRIHSAVVRLPVGTSPAAPAGQQTTTAPTAPATPSIDLHANPRAVAARAHVPVLTWHQLRNWTAADSAADRPYIMPPATFRAELDALADQGYHAISPDQLIGYLTTGAPLPSRPVLLSFDDSDGDQIPVALPELRRHHFTATFFIMTVVLDKPHYMSTFDVRALDRDGMTVGAHTWDHHRVDQYQGADWRIQIEQPTKQLAHIVGHPIRYFAYPYGVWSAAAFPHLAQAGLIAAFQLEEQPLDAGHPLYTLRRAIASPYWSTARFLSEVRSFSGR